MLISFFLLLCLILISPLDSLAQQPRGFQVADLAGLKEVSEAQISPDGKLIVFTLSESSPDGSRMISRLWLVPTQGREVRRLTRDEANESSPRWSPDGKLIAFYSDRDKQPGLWTISPASGEPRLVAHIYRTNFYLTHAGESFTWAPDSRRLAFLSSPETLAETARSADSSSGEGKTSNQSDLSNIPEQIRRPLTREEIDKLPTEIREMILRLQGQAGTQNSSVKPNNALTLSAPSSLALDDYLSKLPDDPRVVTRLQYKSRTAFADHLQSHIFIADLTTRQVQQITFGHYYKHSINWSPKSEEIVFVSNREIEPDKINNTDLFTVNASTRQVRQLTYTKGCEWTPIFSPDGQDIAFTATKRAITTIDRVAEDTHVFFMPAANVAGQGSEARELSKEQDRRVFVIKWSHDSRFVLFTASDRGKIMLYQATRFGSVRQLLDYEAQISSFSVAADGSLAMTISDATHPAEVYATRTPGKFEPVTKVHETWLGRFQSATPQPLTFDNEGMTIQGWLYPPIGLRPDDHKKYPVVLSVHGGPHGMFGYSFNPTAQALSARGYGVLLINPRGSSGYGQKFADGCVNDWGGGDYRDLMKGVDYALSKFPFLDKDRMGVTDGSYGGYMTNWVITQTNRFKAAVTVASLANLIGFYATSLYQDLIHAEFTGYPWDNFDLLWDRSPLKHIKKVKTPTLIVHGEQDNDVHITQAEEFYTALRMQEVETTLVRYPREGHGFREPRHREDQLVRMLIWFDRLLSPRDAKQN